MCNEKKLGRTLYTKTQVLWVIGAITTRMWAEVLSGKDHVGVSLPDGLFSSRFGVSVIWQLACKLNRGLHFKPNLFQTSDWYKLKHRSQANDKETGLCASHLNSLQPLLPGILSTHRG